MKKCKLIFALLLSASILSGCASSAKNAPKIDEVTTVETTTEAITEENSVVTTATQQQTTTATTKATTTNTPSTNNGEKVNSSIMAKAESGAKQRTSHYSTPAPSTTSAPTGARIIATSASICDIMDRLGIELVGVPETTVSALASRYNGVTTVGSPMSPDMEIIKSLKPTDVVSPDTLKTDLEIQYKNIGVNSTFLNLRSVKGLYDSVKIIGDKYGKSNEANAIVNEYTTFINNYKSKHSGQSPKVLVLMGLPGSYLVATQNSYAGSLVELAGGTNVFHDASKDFLTINPEEMLAKDPDVIIRTAHGLPKEALEMFEKEFSSNDIWKHFRAVQNGKVYDVDYMLFGMSATFDYPQALAALEPMLYGK